MHCYLFITGDLVFGVNVGESFGISDRYFSDASPFFEHIHHGGLQGSCPQNYCSRRIEDIENIRGEYK